MKGFELKINDEKIFGGIEDGITLIVADIVGDKIKLSFEGTSFNKDKSVNKNIKWFNSELKEGQEFTVKVKKIEKDL